MTENSMTEGPISREEALKIAAEKLRARRKVIVEKIPPSTVIIKIKKEPGVSQLMAAHYEKLRHGLEQGTKLRNVVDQLERAAYETAKVAGVATGVADFALGGLLAYQGGRSVFGRKENFGHILGKPVLETTSWKGGSLKLLGSIGAWRYAPVTMVARTALNLAL